MATKLPSVQKNYGFAVGENTFPNAVVFLSGYSETDLQQVCYSRDSPQDSCPYIWKRFDSSKYLTAHLEDEPSLNIFNYEKFGFLRQQVDFYLRPFMLDVYPVSFFFELRHGIPSYHSVLKICFVVAEALRIRH